ncbi:STAS domain-containing protein [Virgibacillus ainsalahensis]
MSPGKKLVEEEIKAIGKKFEEAGSDFTERLSTGFFEHEIAKENIIELKQILDDTLNSRGEMLNERIVDYGARTGEIALQNNKTLVKSIQELSGARRETWNLVKEIMLELEVSNVALLEVTNKFDPLFDLVISSFSNTYIKSYEENIQRAEDEFLQLSAPVITIFDEVAVLPIIGGIDEKRAELLMKTALYETGKKDLSHLFIDLSGVKLIDTMVAYNIFKIVQSLELVGVETVLAGIRPEVSQTMVSLGIDFEKIKTYSSLQQALNRHMHIVVQK